MLYEKILNYFIDLIERGAILPGEKLPSLRKVTQLFDVSLSTAVEAYRKLELYGYATVKNRSGYQASLPNPSESYLETSKSFKSKVTEVTHPDEIVDLYLQTLDKNMAPFGIASPDPNKFPNRMISRNLALALKNHPQCHGQYLFGRGLPELRLELTKWIRPWVGQVSHDDILITNGCIEALNIALATECSAGDIVVVESPCYFGILQALHNHNLQALEVRTDPLKGPDPEALEALARKHKIRAMISTANVQNPLGYTMSDERKKQILEICHKYKIRLIEDDIYGEVAFDKKRPRSYKYFDRNQVVTYCSSFSKSIGPGLRLGWCIPAENKMEAIKYKLNLNLATSSLTQYLGLNLLKKENILKTAHTLAGHYENNIHIYSAVIQKELADQVSFSRPQGYFFLWLRVEALDSLKVLSLAKKQKLSFTPGPLFSPTRQFQSYLRINCAHEFNEERHSQLIRLCKLLQA